MSLSTNSLVRWETWNEEAFLRAKSENKPVLLAISAVWCHWCHVMDKENYASPEVADFINSHFVPIRVDTDRRPDINRRYNMGGWPTTAFLTSDGDVITGGTYIPPEEFLTVLERVSRLNPSGADGSDGEAALPAGKPGENVVRQLSTKDSLATEEIVNDVIKSILSAYDPVHGGLGRAPKFPHADVLHFMLAAGRLIPEKDQEAGLTDKALFTLRQMAQGGMYDNIGGGFFRYATRRNWSEPHYEKMCQDNAELLELYLTAYQLTQDNLFRQVAEGIIAYVQELLQAPEGGFYGSQDADEAYYRLPGEKRRESPAPRVDKTVFSGSSALMAASFLQTASILDRNELTEIAKGTAQFLRNNLSEPDAGVHHYWAEGTPELLGEVADQLATAKLLLDLYQQEGDRAHLKQAQQLLDLCLTYGWSRDENCLLDELLLPQKKEDYGYLNYPSISLENNSQGAVLLMTLGHLTGGQQYVLCARDILGSFAHRYQEHKYMAAPYVEAVLGL